MKEKLLTTREVSQILEISEKDIIDLANANLLPCFKVAGEFLRFKKEDVARIKETIRKKYNLGAGIYQRRERIRDFFYFNNFYIICTAIIIFFLWIIFKGIYF
ncbi:MAG: helix-turn-helix domain-containing protein [Candidatus Omnitrophica bacterium]|nr:helix-turn-helix domain-containing protein [Candidatus Omnitrophota bacterium]MBU0878750.1 helix-turn-helix domain-containing protein [Candidatus Omnitrophota bacterium]MBU1133285.1 helix-turn-helix domain-containing protein [Candidatus Omnitrophota bacterium]MBU1366634.1 helix-turn-helix domain-containing protein [Candidatus Omnitrophota bacterium]MBU1524127.1 helix-turn-helix domain-containing protein [Candidatus Omnitrophota bacterium]